eukprot:m.96228 g.96228  ORF g.96228 m.96228 type:complete len:80 (+) comp12459_c0_seq7:1588-1827(+)
MHFLIHTNIIILQLSGLSVLMIAVENRRTEIVKILLSNGVDVNALSKAYETARTVAHRRGYSDIAKILIENGGTIFRYE